MQLERFDPTGALASLKTFQRRTVDYVFGRMFDGADPTRQFLVADEVGLGKTMVARGIIAMTIERLWDTTPRIDVLYICSNQAIAAQNINRLNVFGKEELALPTRLTLVPLRMRGKNSMADNKVNFISLTPGTSFDLRSATGVVEERAFLYHLLRRIESSHAKRYNLLQVHAGDETWEWQVNNLELDGVEASIVDSFVRNVQGDAELLAELGEAFDMFWYRRKKWPEEHQQLRNSVIAKLRSKLSRACVHALQPDLIVLDEFQRFRDLLHGSSDAALLARELFDYTNNGQAARTLLLSATPYKMLTLQGDAEEDGQHHRDFLDTITFLYGAQRGRDVAKSLEVEMKHFRDFLRGLPALHEEAAIARDRVEARLRHVISRTERVNNTSDRDSMVREVPMHLRVEPADLVHAALVAKVAKVIDAPDITEYWKSAPYLLNFMRDYALKRQLKAALKHSNPALDDALRAARPAMLDRSRIANYEPVMMANGRLRALADDVFGQGLDQHLWLPPSLPYYGEGVGASGAPLTKSLVFSSWSMVPDAIAALLSYEAERRAVGEPGQGRKRPGYFDTHRTRPLQFSTNERLTGLRAMLLVCPSPTLASTFDPYAEFVRAKGKLSLQDARELAREALARRLNVGQAATGATDTADGAWEWAGPSAMDHLGYPHFSVWLASPNGLSAIATTASVRASEEDTGFADHVVELARTAGRLDVAAIPDEVLDVLSDVALGSPATCALRALHRVAPELSWDDPVLLQGAATVAWGFRTLFNQHESVALLRGESDESYWRAVLQFCASHNLQAVLDEYAHYLVDAEGLSSKPHDIRASKVAEAIANSLSIRPALIDVDDPMTKGKDTHHGSFKMRGRFAMRLGDYTDEDNGAERLGAVRDAFNSPFRPFVLASTSVGQEGLDFHPYCYRIYHWNLPGNPVDLEQREGRIHRFKSHAVRLNLAHKQGDTLRQASDQGGEPWAAMFAAARAESSNDSDLVPYWLYEGPTSVERRVPMLPFSREHERLDWLKRSLTVYRLAFGQPRQDDLLNYLNRLSVTFPPEELAKLQISLQPRDVAGVLGKSVQ
jgi:hypothetical protein